MNDAEVIGAGLAGCEAAYYLAENGVKVTLRDIKPQRFTPAHSDKNFGELVCSNSLKSNDVFGNACGLLKQEMRALSSLTMQAAEQCKVPAGGALAVDRGLFSQYITEKILSHPNITFVCGEVEQTPKERAVVATGPLTCAPLAEDIARVCGGNLFFYDASAPIIARDGIDFSKCFYGDRYGKGGDDYINCPLTEEEYLRFTEELVRAERVRLREFEKREIFEGCMPVEIMAARGKDTLRFAMMKPVGLKDAEGRAYYAVVQLRKENAAGTAYNLVGFQTNLKYGEQKRVFGMIPALKNAEFLRYGVMHRNTYVNAPQCLNADFSLKSRPTVFLAGQITGVEGYVESAASGILCGIHALRKLSGKPTIIPPDVTVCGGLSAHISACEGDYQPMNANFGILAPSEVKITNKKLRYAYLAQRALEAIEIYKENIRK